MGFFMFVCVSLDIDNVQWWSNECVYMCLLHIKMLRRILMIELTQFEENPQMGIYIYIILKEEKKKRKRERLYI
jgi:hypothetical protein